MKPANPAKHATAQANPNRRTSIHLDLLLVDAKGKAGIRRVQNERQHHQETVSGVTFLAVKQGAPPQHALRLAYLFDKSEEDPFALSRKRTLPLVRSCGAMRRPAA